MWNNYFKIAGRTLLRSKGYAFINIAGLALGMAVCLLLLLFVDHERSFDVFHAQKDRIYRLDEIQAYEGMDAQHVALSMFPMGPTLKAENPEIESFVRVIGASDLLVYQDRQFLLENAVWVDSTFFDVFDFELVQGDEKTALAAPGNALLTETTARTVFGDADPLGKTFISGDTPLRVTGILRDIPTTSHLQFEAVYSVRTIERPDWMENWGGNWLVTYLLLKKGADPRALQARFVDFEKRHINEEAEKDQYTLYLQPLTDVHLGSSDITHDYRNFRKFDRKYVLVFSILAVFVLTIAAINFMNISTARASRRAKEVGVRKTLGARRFELAQQFLGESLLMTGLSLVLALGMAAAALPFMARLTDRDLSYQFFVRPDVVGFVLATALFVGFMAGIYPALVISSFKPIRVLKQALVSTTFKSRRFTLRNGLVVFQFTLAISMVVGTLLTLQQLRYMQQRNTGFDRQQVVTIPLNQKANEKYRALKTAFRQQAGVQDVTASAQRLGNNIHQSGMKVEGNAGIREISSSQLAVDYTYLTFYGMQMAAGRTFSEDRGTDAGQAFVVNQAMVREMGWKDPIGKRMAYGWQDSLGTVIGVVKDFNFNSLHHKIQPIAISVQEGWYDEMSVRIDQAHMNETLALLKSSWDEIVGDRPFKYEFLDEHFARLYESDRKVSQVVGMLAVLAIFIACLGLFGLAATAIDQRIKEIGIRKVLGASITQLVTLLSGSFVTLVGISFVIAAPLSYLLIDNWLANFAYRIDIHPLVFIVAGFAAFSVALLTVSFRSIRAARLDPVKTLRYE